jgi:hypothetical protein
MGGHARGGQKFAAAWVAAFILIAAPVLGGCGDEDGTDELAQQQAIEDARRDGARLARQNERIRELEREVREQDGSNESVPTASINQAAGDYVAGSEPYSPSDPAYTYVADVPVGGGWSGPTESYPTDGALLRTSWRGPDGTLLLIDRTPNDVPDLGGSYDTVDTVPHPAFGEATKYWFSESSGLPDCNGRPCVDFLINDGQGGGWAVLAGGPSLAIAESIATSVMQSVRYDN